jgi:hypothetical protein
MLDAGAVERQPLRFVSEGDVSNRVCTSPKKAVVLVGALAFFPVADLASAGKSYVSR